MQKETEEQVKASNFSASSFSACRGRHKAEESGGVAGGSGKGKRNVGSRGMWRRG